MINRINFRYNIHKNFQAATNPASTGHKQAAFKTVNPMPANPTLMQGASKAPLGHYPLNYYSTLTFGAKGLPGEKSRKSSSKLPKQIEQLSLEQFPSENLYNKAIAASKDPSNKATIHTIHMEYFTPLLNCETLDEAKALYPEFQNVIDAKDFVEGKENSELPYIIKQIKTGKIQDIKIENLSLYLLKTCIAMAISTERKESYFGFASSTVEKTLAALNINKPDTKYLKMVLRNDPEVIDVKRTRMINLYESPAQRKAISDKMKEYCKDPDVKRQRSDSMKQVWDRSPERKAELSKASKERWQDPDYAAELTKKISEALGTPEQKMRNSKSQREAYKRPEVQKRHLEAVRKFRDENPECARLYSIAWDLHPDFKQLMKKVAKEEFPILGRIRAKELSGQKLDHFEDVYISLYHKRCNELCPGMVQTVSQLFSRLWQDFKAQRKENPKLELSEFLLQYKDELNISDELLSAIQDSSHFDD